MHAIMNLPASFEGRVTKKTGSAYTVSANGTHQICTLSSSLHSSPSTESIVIGDLVRCNPARQITDLLPRQNLLARRSAVPMPSAHAQRQVIAANVDQVVPILAVANPRLAWNLLDRFLVSAEAAEIPVLICLTKWDLVKGTPHGEEIEAVAAEYQAIGYPLILTSAPDGKGLEQLRAGLRGRLSLLVGKSGVGKTTLLNSLEPGLDLRTQVVTNATGKGRHTTTHHEIFELPGGGSVIDTPGIREFGLWDVGGDDLAYFFPEMRPWLGHCRFRSDCSHDDEPGCAVRQAVNAGQISPYRYQSFLKLKAEL